MPTVSRETIIAVCFMAFTGALSSWLSFLAAWSHFSDAANTGIAATLAAMLSVIVGSLIWIIYSRTLARLDNFAKANPNVMIVADDKTAANTSASNVVSRSAMVENLKA